ncbi:MAG: hypothetical protein KC502_01215 [Myxococcales bacterium]|nr:hypothetical protein [Myxococcales bacterium]
MPRIPIELSRALVIVAALWMTGCGNNPAPQPTYICNNSFTGLCEPCPGVSVCVDPETCEIVSCGGEGDVPLFHADSSSGDVPESSDVVADSSQDVELVDTGTPDTGPTDTGTPDTGTPDTGQVDTGPSDTAACTEGAKTCVDGTTPQFCFQGQWMKLAACGSGYACKAGGCTCKGECLALGQVSCISGVSAFKTCQLDGSCLRWGVPLACQPGQVCEQGQCKSKSGCSPACTGGKVCQSGQCVTPTCAPACTGGQVCENGKCVTPTCTPACPSGQVCTAGKCQPVASGTLSCGQIMACVSQFSQGPKDTINIDACVAKGTATAQAEYNKRKACIALSCQKLIDAGKANEAMLCVYTYCPKEQSGCLGSGTKTCDQFGGCLTGCGTSQICLVNCHADASIDALKAWYLLGTCGEQKCAGKTGNDYGTCAAQQCGPSFQGCFGSTGGGGYSCAQVLQCAGQCGNSKACAQDCKAKASAQGLSDLNALLTCSNGVCKSFCSTGTQAQCNACLDIYCKKEQAACK